MPRSKKTPTKIIDGAAPRHTRRFQQIRQEVAAEAARIIVTEGQPNYHVAKRKAAERIGTSERLALPSNSEVEEALRQYQGLYGGTAHVENLEHLREIAVGAMSCLEKFTPRLVGPVLEGTANEHSRVTLHVFSDAIEPVIFHFLESATPFNQEQRQIRWYDGMHRTVPIVVFERQGSVVELMIFDEVQLRQAPPSPIDGKPQRRASLTDAECLLTESLATSVLAVPAGPVA